MALEVAGSSPVIRPLKAYQMGLESILRPSKSILSTNPLLVNFTSFFIGV